MLVDRLQAPAPAPSTRPSADPSAGPCGMAMLMAWSWRTLSLLILAACPWPGSPAHAAEALPPEFFENSVRPLLLAKCGECHGEKQAKGGLRVDTREAFFKGGEAGAIVVPGQPDQSPFIKAIRFNDPDLAMPPKRKLADFEIDLLTRWVAQGAPWPQTPASAKAAVAGITSHRRPPAELWSLRPLADRPPPEVPAAQPPAWAVSTIDRHILASLAQRGLSPSPRADPRTLIRRASFDLIGLPPSYEEVEAFAAQASDPAAYPALIDRLLASPRYGERWGRHWLDVARYADTKGYAFTQDRRYPYSYTYRDYVVRAFNDDKPYDRFIHEQIAADKLDLKDDKQALAAMGFLTVGQRFNFNIHDITDDRIDVVTRGLMGLTVTCARCHDHKYDAITMADYYALYGVFASSQEPNDLPLIAEPYPTPEYENYLAELKKREQVVAEHVSATNVAVSMELKARAGDYLSYIARSLPNHKTGPVLAQSPRGELRVKATPRWEAYLGQKAAGFDPVFGLWHELAKLPRDGFGDKAEKLLGNYAGNQAAGKAPPLNSKVLAALQGAKPQTMEAVANVYGQLLENAHRAWQEIQKSKVDPKPTALADSADEQLRQVLYLDNGPANPKAEELKGLVNRAERDKEKDLQKQVDALKATHAGAPPRAMVMTDLPRPNTQHIFLRGKQDRPGDRVDRRFLEVLAHVDGGKPFKEGSGRLELAQAITHRNNPLTARVYANRVWQHHFGASLVRDSSDFGVRTEAPVQLDLLDHLASRFMSDGWSIKKLHRYIMLSRTYQQMSDNRSDGLAADPENRLFWKMNKQRLQFEPTRDALLFASGKLDRTLGGRPVNLTSQPFTARRTLYGTIDRQDLPNLFRTFDFPFPDATSPQRFTTTVPQQALFLMNSPFVQEQSRRFAARPELTVLSQPDRRVAHMYSIAYQRPPSGRERRLATEFVSSYASAPVPAPAQRAWAYGYGSGEEPATHATSSC